MEMERLIANTLATLVNFCIGMEFVILLVTVNWPKILSWAKTCANTLVQVVNFCIGMEIVKQHVMIPLILRQLFMAKLYVSIRAQMLENSLTGMAHAKQNAFQSWQEQSIKINFIVNGHAQELILDYLMVLVQPPAMHHILRPPWRVKLFVNTLVVLANTYMVIQLVIMVALPHLMKDSQEVQLIVMTLVQETLHTGMEAVP